MSFRRVGTALLAGALVAAVTVAGATSAEARRLDLPVSATFSTNPVPASGAESKVNVFITSPAGTFAPSSNVVIAMCTTDPAAQAPPKTLFHACNFLLNPAQAGSNGALATTVTLKQAGTGVGIGLFPDPLAQCPPTAAQRAAGVVCAIVVSAGGLSSSDRGSVPIPYAGTGVPTAYSLSGTVTGSGGTPLAGVTVAAVAGDTTTLATTGPSGTYAFSDLASGTYRLEFRPVPGLGYLGEWYDDQPTAASATPITLSANRTGVDAQLTRTPMAHGRVTSNGVGLGGTAVQVEGPTGVVAQVVTAADGAWSTSLGAPGPYRFAFMPPAGYVSQWYPNRPTPQLASLVTILSGQDRTIDADLVKLGSISGTVRRPGGAPDSFASVVATTAAGRRYSAQADSAGHYRLVGLPAEAYRLQIRPFNSTLYASSYYPGVASSRDSMPVVVSNGADVVANDVTLVAGATISGRVTTPDGPSPFTTVNVVGEDGVSRGTGIGPDGQFEFTGLAAGVQRVQFVPADRAYAFEWYRNQPTKSAARKVNVAASQVVTDINATLAVAASISGTVTWMGQPLAFAIVDVYDDDDELVTSTVTDESGHYKVGRLPAGSYVVHVGPQSNPGILGGYVGGGDSVSDATPIVVRTGEQRTGADVDLESAATISGVVRDGTGAPVADAMVTAFTAAGERTDVTAMSGPDGSYQLVGVLPGSVKVLAEPAPGTVLARTWFGGGATPATATPITVAAGSVVLRTNIRLVEGGVIRGTVLRGSQLSTPGRVTIFGPGDTEDSAVTIDAPSGQWSTRVAPGHYQVRFAPMPDSGGPVLAPTWLGGTAVRSASREVRVAPGRDAQVTQVLSRGATIFGRVTGPFVATTGVIVEAVPVDGSNDLYAAVPSATVRFDGSYSLPGLATSTVKVRFRTTDGSVVQWWDGAGSEGTATPFAITGGTNTRGISARLR